MDDAATVAVAMEIHPREEELFSEALALPANRRVAFLVAQCRGEPDLRRRVESLLRAYAEARDFMETPATRPPWPGK